MKINSRFQYPFSQAKILGLRLMCFRIEREARPFRGSIIILFTLLLACEPKPPCEEGHQLNAKIDYQITSSAEIELPFDYNVQLNFTLKAYERHDTDFVLLGDMEGHRLIEIDISHHTFSRSIVLKSLVDARYPVFMHHYLNADTIVILSGISNAPSRYADSVLYPAGSKASPLSPYRLRGSPYRLRGIRRDTPQASFYHHFQPMVFAEHRYFVDPLPMFREMHKKRFPADTGLPQLGYFQFKEGADLPFQAIPYYRGVAIDTGLFADEQWQTYMAAIDAQHLLVSHSNEDSFLLLDVENGTLKRSQEAGSWLPPVKSLGDWKQKLPAYNTASAVYKELLYDAERQLIFRLAYLPVETDLKPGDRRAFRDRYQWIGVYDMSLKLIAQGLKQPGFKMHPKPDYYKGRFVGVKQGSDRRHLQLQYTVLDTQCITSNQYDSLFAEFRAIRPKISKVDLNHFYRNYRFPPNSLILTVSNRSCPYCVTVVEEYFLKNLQQMEAQQIYLLVSERSASAVLKARSSANIIIDKSNVLEELLEERIDNPAIMRWNGQKVSETMVLPPQEVEHLEHYLEIFKGS